MTDFTKPVQTRSGLPVTIITTEGRGRCSIIGYLGEQDCLTHWLSDGRYTHASKTKHDLINVPKKRVMYVNIYREREDLFYSSEFPLEAGVERIACIRVEYTEGQFDD